MNSILGFSDLLAERISDPELSQYMAVIRSSGKNLLNLINDILDLSKIEAGKMMFKPEPVDITALAFEMNNMFMYKCEEKNILLSCKVESAVPQYVMLDHTRIRQVLFNLLGNAVKFTEKGSISLKICQYPDMEEFTNTPGYSEHSNNKLVNHMQHMEGPGLVLQSQDVSWN